MDSLIDRFADFLRSILAGGEKESDASQDTGRTARARFVDPDVEEAWQELDDYMRGNPSAGGSSTRTQGGRAQGGRARPSARLPDESLRQDYANLEVPFGASIEEVRRSYKSLILKYHPDKHAGNPEKQRVALEITKKINASFERIRAHHEGQG